MQRFLTTLLMILVVPVTAFAAQTALEQSTAALVAAGLDQAVVARLNQSLAARNYGEQQSLRVHAVIQNTLKAGLPAGPVALKAQEGLGKNVDPQRLVGAMQRVQARYAFAYAQARSLEAPQTERLGNTLAESLAAGLSEQDCARLTTQLRERTRDRQRDQVYLNESCQTIRELSRQGVASATVGRVMGAAIQKGYTAREMAQLRAAFNKEASWGNPESVANSLAGAIASGGRGAQLGSRSGAGGGNGSGSGAGSGSGSGSGSGGSGGSGGRGGSGRR